MPTRAAGPVDRRQPRDEADGRTTSHEAQVLRAEASHVGTRDAITYRFRLRPDWAPEVWHVIEQTGYLRVHEGRIRRVDLVCTGSVPDPDLTGAGPEHQHPDP